MRERVGALVGRDARADVGRRPSTRPARACCAATPHRLGFTRRLHHLRRADQRRLIKRVLDDLDVDAKRFTPRAMLAADHRAPRTSCSAPRRTPAADGSIFERRSPSVYRALPGARCAAANAIDFDDLLFEHRQPVRSGPGGARRATSARFRYVLVDEYQDTNHAQYRWSQLPRRGARQPRASSATTTSRIYRWRGADIRNILDFERDFPDAHGRQAGAELPLDADHPRRRQRGHRATTARARRSRCGPRTARGEPIVRYAADDERDEAAVRRRRRSSGCASDGDSRCGDFAVLYRTNAQSRALEDALRARADPLPDHRRHAVLRAARRSRTCSPTCASWSTRPTGAFTIALPAGRGPPAPAGCASAGSRYGAGAAASAAG